MCEIKCKFCGVECKNNLSKSCHERFCKFNPDYEHNIKIARDASRKASKSISDGLKEFYNNNPLNKIEKHEFICQKCGKTYSLMIKKRDFDNGKYSKFCSRSCANTHVHSEQTKEKIRSSLIQSYNESERKNIKEKQYLSYPKHCSICGIELPYSRRHHSTCSKECAHLRQVNAGRIGGKQSAKIMAKRSKNEIAFANKCIETMKRCQILTNEPYFNGWDADIILVDYKIAILWNGIWHYKVVRNNQSLKQIQSRDKIKLKMIEECGYIPYIIKDEGSFSMKKVNEEFETLKKFLISRGFFF